MRSERFLIFSIMQRNLNASAVDALRARLTDTGELRSAASARKRCAVRKGVCVGNNKAETSMEKTSMLMRPTAELGAYLLPNSITEVLSRL